MSAMQGLASVALGYKQGTSMTSVKKLTDILGAAIPAGANAVLLQAESQDVRWTDDGTTAPTTSLGMLLKVGLEPFFYTGPLANLQFINATAGSILNIQLYRVSL